MAGSTCCCVCGNLGANFNYNAMVCGPCRVFFYRCVKYEAPRICLFQGSCIIKNVKRGNCAFCRYQRCLMMNMDESQVCRRNKIKVTQIPPTYVHEFMKFYHPQLLYHFPVPCPVSLEMIELIHRKSLNFHGSSPRFTEQTNLNVGLQEMIKEPELCSSKETACVDAESFCYNFNYGEYAFLRSYGRWISSYFELLVSTFYFTQIPFIDQLKLAQHNACDFEIITAIQHKMTTKCTKFNKIEVKEEEEKSWQNEARSEEMTKLLRLRARSFDYLLSLIGPICKEHKFDDIEFTTMKVINSFRTPCGLSFQAQKLANIARESFILKLAEYISCSQHQLDKFQQLQRVSAILEVGGIVKREAQIISQNYVEMIACDFDGMGSVQLPYELHIQQIL